MRKNFFSKISKSNYIIQITIFKKFLDLGYIDSLVSIDHSFILYYLIFFT